jgi:hypothetical protein
MTRDHLSCWRSRHPPKPSLTIGCVSRARPSRHLPALWAHRFISQASRLTALAWMLSSIVSLTRVSASTSSSMALKSPSISHTALNTLAPKPHVAGRSSTMFAITFFRSGSHSDRQMVSDWAVGLKCLAGDERHDLVDKKNDHSSKHGQRDAFVEACAADCSHDFHSFPLPRDSTDVRSRRPASVNGALITFG